MVVAVVGLLFGLVSCAVAAGLLWRRIDAGPLPVGGFGIRVPATMASQVAWDGGHSAAKPWLGIVAAVSGVSAVVVLILTLATSLDAAFPWALGLMLVTIVLFGVTVAIAAQAARRVH